jgi:hypothetical protein
MATRETVDDLETDTVAATATATDLQTASGIEVGMPTETIALDETTRAIE